MIGGDRSNQIVGHGLISSPTGRLLEREVRNLWQIFQKIVSHWHDEKNDDNDPEKYFGQWHEFVELNTRQSPSYLYEYRSGLTVLKELEEECPDYWDKLFFDHGMDLNYGGKEERNYEFDHRATRLGHLKLYVVDEFIDVYLTSGGYAQFGAQNYNSFIYRSRFDS